MNLGALLWQEGEHSEAVEHYEQAIALEPEFSEAYVYLGWAMLFFRRIDEAMRYREAVVRFNPSSAKGHMDLGSALQVRGRIEEAIYHFRKAITLNGLLTGAYVNYAYAQRVAEGAYAPRRRSPRQANGAFRLYIKRLLRWWRNASLRTDAKLQSGRQARRWRTKPEIK